MIQTESTDIEDYEKSGRPSVPTKDEKIAIVREDEKFPSKNCCLDCKACCVKRWHVSVKRKGPEHWKAESRMLHHENALAHRFLMVSNYITFRYFQN
ncbi:hypothetical protein AVEN_224705-1 [Araneus ventricosus]|uniref:Uncharacterized protein n=1 Tax=Araneus ventricosus TaxID=182803 RepID=A0A4Y2EVW5_ARAVE|nr:hypothetical protein AVEN_224705-1 [Araneus ventricosus]